MTRTARISAAVSALALLLGACGGTPATVSPSPAPATSAAATSTATPVGENYKIGAIFDVTGGGSALGTPERDTAKMLEEQVNAKGGITGPDGKLHKLQVIVYDNQSQETQSVLVAKRLIEEDKVPVIIGPSQTGTTLAILDTTQKAQIPLISAAANIGIVTPIESRQWVFKTPQSDPLIMTTLLEYLKSKGITKVGWMSVNNAFGDGGRTQFEALSSQFGISATASERFAADDKDMSGQLTKIKGTNPQALVVWAVPPAASVVTKNAADLGLKLPVFQSHGIGTPDFITLAGPAANGVIFPVGKLLVASGLPDTDPQKAVLTTYTADYQKAYGKAPTTFGGHAWDAFWLAVNALKKAGPDPKGIRTALEGTKEFVGISGVFTFSDKDHNGLDKRAVTMVTVADGKWAPAK